MAIIESMNDYKKLEFGNINLSASLLFKFNTYDEWVNRATLLYNSIGFNEEQRKQLCITLDTKGRLCHRGGDFMRSRDDNTFPVSIYIMDFTL